MSKRVAVTVDGEIRRILTFVEKENGEVYLIVHSGSQMGIPPNHKTIGEHRYSLHASNNSESYNAFKRTMRFDNEDKVTSLNLNDAVKSKKGFAWVFGIVFNDLIGGVYDPPLNEAGEVVHLGEYSRKTHTLFLWFFVGNRSTEFKWGGEGRLYREIEVGMFKVVLVYTFGHVPSTPFSSEVGITTYPPDSTQDINTRTLFEGVMRSISVDECILVTQKTIQVLYRSVIKEWKAWLTQEANFYIKNPETPRDAVKVFESYLLELGLLNLKIAGQITPKLGIGGYAGLWLKR